MEKIGGARSGAASEIPGDRERPEARRSGAIRSGDPRTRLHSRRGRRAESPVSIRTGVTDGSHADFRAGSARGGAEGVGGGARPQPAAAAAAAGARAPRRPARGPSGPLGSAGPARPRGRRGGAWAPSAPPRARRRRAIAALSLRSSGSGKSTLMNLIGCLDRPTAGSYRSTAGRRALDADGLAALRNREIGFVFQQFNLLPRTTALENVELPLLYAGIDRARAPRKRAWRARAVGLGDRRTTARTSSPAASSSGWRSPAPWSTSPSSSWPTSRPATSTAAPASRSWRSSRSSTREGITIVLVTHEPTSPPRPRVVRFATASCIDDAAPAPAPATRCAAPMRRGRSRPRMRLPRRSARALRALARQQAALRPDHARHHHRRGGGDRHGGDRRRRPRASTKQIRSLGANLIIVRPATSRRRRRAWGRRRAADDSPTRDAAASRARSPGVAAAAPFVRTVRARSSPAAPTGAHRHARRPRLLPSRATGTSRAARSSTEDGDRGAAKVVLLGQTVARNLFGDGRPDRPDDPHAQRARSR